MKPVLSHLVLLAVVTTACGDSFSSSSVAGVYERVGVPTILSVNPQTAKAPSGLPAIAVHMLLLDWEHYTLTAANNWTWETSRRTIVLVLDLSGTVVDSFDIPVSSPVISGSFTLSPPDSVFFSEDGVQTLAPLGGTIVPPDLVVRGTTYIRR